MRRKLWMDRFELESSFLDRGFRNSLTPFSVPYQRNTVGPPKVGLKACMKISHFNPGIANISQAISIMDLHCTFEDCCRGFRAVLSSRIKLWESLLRILSLRFRDIDLVGDVDRGRWSPDKIYWLTADLLTSQDKESLSTLEIPADSKATFGIEALGS